MQLGPVERQPALFPGPDILVGARADHETLPAHGHHQDVHGTHGFHHDHLAGQAGTCGVGFRPGAKGDVFRSDAQNGRSLKPIPVGLQIHGFQIRFGQGQRPLRQVFSLHLPQPVPDMQVAIQEVHVGTAQKAGHKQVPRPVVYLQRRPYLLYLPLMHDHHPITERHGLGLIMRDIEHRSLHPREEQFQFGPHLDAQFGVQVAERFVQQERLGVAGDRPSQRDPLPLAAAQLARLPIQQVVNLQRLGRLLHAALDFRPRHLAHLEPKADVVPHGLVGIQRVALKHHGDVPLARRHRIDQLVVDVNLALAGILQAGGQVQRGGLAAAAGSHQRHELPVRDDQVQVLERLYGTEALADMPVTDLGHDRFPGSAIP